MKVEEILIDISKRKELPENLDEFWESLSQNDAYFLWCAASGLEITSTEDFSDFEEGLRKNFKIQYPSLIKMEYWGKCILDTISEDAFCRTFDENIIRDALRRGFYPMSVKIDILNFLSVRFHRKKCLVTPETFRIPHNVKKLIEKKFQDYTIIFNRNFEECINAIKEAYPENWLCPELTEAFINIHKTPDENISVDSVEIRHNGELVAGEIGFITGNSYASLTGFHKEKDIGNVQMALLGQYLFDNGFAYWDLGMSIPYKYRYGATDNDRKNQTKLWNLLEKKRLAFPEKTEIPLGEFFGEGVSEFENKAKPLDTNLILPFPEPNTKYAEYGRQICEITESIPLQLLYSAYMQGVFPWFNESDGDPVTWYSTDPRFVLYPQDFHYPKSLRRFLRKCPYTFTMDKCFRRVMKECSKMKREGQEGTWIGEKMMNAYTKFHKAGFAHSFEVWHKGKLAGGFYGVLIGKVFFGESMFTLEPDSSKSAFVLFMKAFTECGGVIVDSQSYTDNIARYGAKNISRDAFLRIESEALYSPLEKDLASEFYRQVALLSS